MTIKKDEFIIIDQKYKEGIAIDRYNNEVQLVVAKEGDDGVVRARWCFPEIKKEPSKKAIPWKLTLGVKEQAIQALERLLYMVEHGEGLQTRREEPKVEMNTEKVSDGKLPF